jgi:hypothetical protein
MVMPGALDAVKRRPKGARPLKPRWVGDIVADCRRNGVAVFHKQWGTYQSNPLVVEQGMSIKEATASTILEREEAWLMGSWYANSRYPACSRVWQRKTLLRVNQQVEKLILDTVTPATRPGAIKNSVADGPLTSTERFLQVVGKRLLPRQFISLLVI